VKLQANNYTAGGRLVTFDTPCEYFTAGKAKASTLSLSVLVAIEMFNALNALSEVRLLTMWENVVSTTHALPALHAS